jgi:iron complex outermembrane receptor protein
MHRRLLCGVFTTLISGAALAQSVAPQGDSKPAAIKASGGLEEITVTANRREQNLQDVGTSIAAFTGDQLKDLGVSRQPTSPPLLPMSTWYAPTRVQVSTRR